MHRATGTHTSCLIHPPPLYHKTTTAPPPQQRQEQRGTTTISRQAGDASGALVGPFPWDGALTAWNNRYAPDPGQGYGPWLRADTVAGPGWCALTPDTALARPEIAYDLWYLIWHRLTFVSGKRFHVLGGSVYKRFVMFVYYSIFPALKDVVVCMVCVCESTHACVFVCLSMNVCMCVCLYLRYFACACRYASVYLCLHLYIISTRFTFIHESSARLCDRTAFCLSFQICVATYPCVYPLASSKGQGDTRN